MSPASKSATPAEGGRAARKLVIAIDGPAGAGKSTLASRLARRLGYVNIETGGMYRALALKAIENDVSFDDSEALVALARNSRIELEPAHEGNRVLLDGVNVSDRIREEDVTEAASRVSIHPAVRAWMVARQRELGAGGGIVMEGRDIGTKVFPDADVKVFLDADPGIRGGRRVKQEAAGRLRPQEQIARELAERDLRDRSRPASPLVPAADAVHIDSSALTVEQVIEQVERLVAEKLGPA
ncbi:MAG: (d)CMP kinase [Acidobacteria bacterium]|nr:(d)CMP kinase [Acidobacteriota bacterium]